MHYDPYRTITSFGSDEPQRRPVASFHHDEGQMEGTLEEKREGIMRACVIIKKTKLIHVYTPVKMNSSAVQSL